MITHRRILHCALALLIIVSLIVSGESEGFTPSWDPPSYDVFVSELDGLPFDSFVEVSYRLYLERHPLLISAWDLEEELDVRRDRLEDYSLSYLEESNRIEIFLLDRLRKLDRSELSAAQQMTFDVYEWILDDLVRAHAFPYHSYLVSHSYISSVDWATYDLLKFMHPLQSAADCHDYITRLHQLGEQFHQLLLYLNEQAQAGIVLPAGLLLHAVTKLDELINVPIYLHPLYLTFERGVNAISALPAEERVTLLQQALVAINDVVIPAYLKLSIVLIRLQGYAPLDYGVGQYANGEAFYEYAVHSYTQSDLSAEEIHQLGQEQTERIAGEIRQAAANLGYPEGLSMGQIYERVAIESGFLDSAALFDEHAHVLDTAIANIDQLRLVSDLPSIPLEVVPLTEGAFYRLPSLDGSRPGQLGVAASFKAARFTIPSTTYQAYAGHHLPIAISFELPIPLVRRTATFSGFSMGLGLYVDRLAWESGWYAGDPYADLGRLQAEITEAVRLVVDTGLHVLGWSFDEAVAYFERWTGKSLLFSQHEILSHAVNPARLISPTLGFLKILELLERFREAAGDDYDPLAFHVLLLGQGPLPLPILERWIESNIRDLAAED